MKHRIHISFEERKAAALAAVTDEGTTCEMLESVLPFNDRCNLTTFMKKLVEKGHLFSCRAKAKGGTKHDNGVDYAVMHYFKTEAACTAYLNEYNRTHTESLRTAQRRANALKVEARAKAERSMTSKERRRVNSEAKVAQGLAKPFSTIRYANKVKEPEGPAFAKCQPDESQAKITKAVTPPDRWASVGEVPKLFSNLKPGQYLDSFDTYSNRCPGIDHKN